MKIKADAKIVDGRLKVLIDIQDPDMELDEKNWQQQPRVPAGNPEGGEWGPGGGSWSRGEGPGEGKWDTNESEGTKPKTDKKPKKNESADSGDDRVIVGNGAKYENFPEAVRRQSEDEFAPFMEQNPKLEDALDRYQSVWYSEINEHLREGRDSGRRGIASTIKSLDKITDRGFSEPVTVYRGIQGDTGIQILKSAEKILKSGGYIEDKGFASTSLDASTAYYFAGSGRPDSVMLQISTKKGVSLDRSTSGSESEILLPRNVKMKVVGIDRNVRINHNGSQGKHGITESMTVVRMEVL